MFRFVCWLLLGGDEMVELFVALIIHGTRTFSQVPLKLQDAVRAMLLTLGLDENGVPIVTP
jgi:hypothetical protein